MIWIAISIFISTIILCATLICIKFEDKAYNNAINCLNNLCEAINDNFPGSNLKVVINKRSVKVIGEIKYIKNS